MVRITSNDNTSLSHFQKQPNKNYLLLFFGGLILGIVFLFISVLLGGKDVFFSLLHSDPSDTYMDFFNSVYDASFSDPYTMRNVIYPPLTYVIYRFCALFLPDIYQLGAFAARDSQSGRIVILVYTALQMLALFYLLYKGSRTGAKADHVLGITILLFSLPMMYCYERGNIVLLSLVFLFYFVANYRSDSPVQRELALIALALAAGIKLYPALFGLLLLKEKRIKEALRCIGYGILAFVLPFFFFGGLSDIPVLFQNYSRTSGNMSVRGCGYKINIGNMVTYWNTLFDAKLSSSIIVLFFLVCLIIVFFASKHRWQQYASLAMMMILLPGFSYIYTMIFMIIPLWAFLFDTPKAQQLRGLNLCYTGLFILQFAYLPFGHISTSVQTISDKYLLNAATVEEASALLAMLILLVVQTLSERLSWKLPQRISTAHPRASSLIGIAAALIVAAGTASVFSVSTMQLPYAYLVDSARMLKSFSSQGTSSDVRLLNITNKVSVKYLQNLLGEQNITASQWDLQTLKGSIVMGEDALYIVANNQDNTDAYQAALTANGYSVIFSGSTWDAYGLPGQSWDKAETLNLCAQNGLVGEGELQGAAEDVEALYAIAEGVAQNLESIYANGTAAQYSRDILDGFTLDLDALNGWFSANGLSTIDVPEKYALAALAQSETQKCLVAYSAGTVTVTDQTAQLSVTGGGHLRSYLLNQLLATHGLNAENTIILSTDSGIGAYLLTDGALCKQSSLDETTTIPYALNLKTSFISSSAVWNLYDEGAMAPLYEHYTLIDSAGDWYLWQYEEYPSGTLRAGKIFYSFLSGVYGMETSGTQWCRQTVTMNLLNPSPVPVVAEYTFVIENTDNVNANITVAANGVMGSSVANDSSSQISITGKCVLEPGENTLTISTNLPVISAINSDARDLHFILRRCIVSATAEDPAVFADGTAQEPPEGEES